jgi:hypothetical protein
VQFLIDIYEILNGSIRSDSHNITVLQQLVVDALEGFYAYLGSYSLLFLTYVPHE